MRLRLLIAPLLLSIAVVACSSGPVNEPSPTATRTPSPTTFGSPTPEPAIVVTSPLPGDEVTSPVTIQGNADVFEATVSISILDSAGNEIVRTFTTATCGTGCRGTFSKAVRFTVDKTQPGTARVYESSAKDGKPVNLVSIPVTLVA